MSGPYTTQPGRLSRIGAARPRQRLDFSLPAINVILLLLFFFLVAGTIASREETAVDPPLTRDLPLERLPRPLLIVWDRGNYALDGIPIAGPQIIERARQRLTETKSEALHVLAPGEAPAGPFLEVIGILQSAALPVKVVTLDRRAWESGRR
jgi:biopolymer transport protein ExbD